MEWIRQVWDNHFYIRLQEKLASRDIAGRINFKMLSFFPQGKLTCWYISSFKDGMEPTKLFSYTYRMWCRRTTMHHLRDHKWYVQKAARQKLTACDNCEDWMHYHFAGKNKKNKKKIKWEATFKLEDSISSFSNFSALAIEYSASSAGQ